MLRTLVRLESVRSAEPPTSSGIAGAKAASARWLACRVAIVGRVSAISAFSAAIASCQASGRRPATTRSNSARSGCFASRFSQARRAAVPRLPAAAQRSARSRGTVNGGCCQSSACFAASDSVCPSGLPLQAAVPALFGAAKPMMVRQAISVGFFDRSASDSAAKIWAGSCPSTRFVAQPSALNRFNWSSDDASAAGPSSETLLSSHSTVSFSSRKCPARPAASWLMPSIRSPSEAMTHVRWSTRLLPNRAAIMRSARAMPTAVAKPWPSGPVVVSMPGCSPCSGWPVGRAVQLPEPREVVEPHASMASQVQQRIEQHRAMPSGQHKAVAVRPARVGSVEAQQPRPKRGADVRHTHRHAGMAGPSRLDRVDRQRPNRVCHPPLDGGGAG